MHNAEQLKKRIRFVAKEDGRYKAEAFFFVTELIGYTVEWIKSGVIKPQIDYTNRGIETDPSFHVSGYEILLGMKKLARERWGCMARCVLESWGIYKTIDVGNIVFLMIADEELEWNKRENDSIDDFKDVFDLEKVFDNWDEE